MSTATAEAPIALASGPQPDLRIYPHSPLLYWWPVWAVGFLMALWTMVDGYQQLLVPEATVVDGDRLILPPGTAVVPTLVHVARSKVPGVVFVMTLLAVIILSHAYLRGPWSLVIGASVVAAAFLIGWMDWWGPLWRWVNMLTIHINLGGYLVISTVLFIVWAVHVFVLDRRTCLIVSTGQVRLRDELGDQEEAYDTSLVTCEKKPFDWFRWLVGWGAGDLIVRVGGSQPRVVELPNVVGVGGLLARVQQRLRTRDVV